MNRLSIEERAKILNLLVEGSSMRAVSRITGASINTVTKLLVDTGRACAEFQDGALRNLPCKRVQADEIHSFVFAKSKNADQDMKAAGTAGDVWTWTAICADTKLAVSWMVGRRDIAAATVFIDDVASRLAGRIQLSTDGHKPYLNAIAGAFGRDIDYGRLIKYYKPNGDFMKSERMPTVGCPDYDHISTSFVERQNLTMRMSIKRFARATNAHSKKVENHAHAIALHFMFYNFGRVHKTLKMTPAMAAGIASHVWSLEEIAGLVKDEAPKVRGPYRKRAA
ncbi:MAG: IS1 family transposase [Gammaproteobacteria bacterium]|nr:IS1 family transposase [Gammaproteobacteria bacterium]